MTLPADENAGSPDLLAIYLNDHFAGATGGVELFKRAAQSHGGAERNALVELARQVEEDREALAQVMADLGVPVDRPKAAVGWIAEKAGRLKPNGHLFSRSPSATSWRPSRLSWASRARQRAGVPCAPCPRPTRACPPSGWTPWWNAQRTRF